jgi:transposase
MNESAVSIESAVPEPAVAVRTSRRNPAATRQKWVERIERFRSSDLTVAQFCLTERVSVPAFYFWRRTLAAESTTQPRDRPIVVPVRIARPTSGVEVVLPCGAVLRFSADCDPQHVAALLRAVGAIPC